MDESIADRATKEEWQASHHLAQKLFGEHFNMMLEQAQTALKPLLEGQKVINVVDEQTTKLIKESQTAIIMLRAAAWKEVE